MATWEETWETRHGYQCIKQYDSPIRDMWMEGSDLIVVTENGTDRLSTLLLTENP